MQEAVRFYPLWGEFLLKTIVSFRFKLTRQARSQTLEDIRALQRIFQYQILHSPAVGGITKLVLTGQLKSDDLSQVLFHIAPRLPNLSKIHIHQSEEVGTPPASSTGDYRWIQLLNLAKNVTEWAFDRRSIEQVLPLVNANKQNVRSLTFRDVFTQEGRLDPLLELVSTCRSLSNLVLHLRRLRPHDPSTPTPQIFSRPNLDLDYSRASRLVSLKIVALEFDLDQSVLEFASRFPNLRTLDLSALGFPRSPSIPDNSPPHLLPELSILRLSFMGFHSSGFILQRLSLPSLRHLSNTPWIPQRWMDRDFADFNPERSGGDARSLASAIKESCGPSLQLVTFDVGCPKSGPFAACVQTHFKHAHRRYLRTLEKAEGEGSDDGEEVGEENQGGEVDGEEPLVVPYRSERIIPRIDPQPLVFPRYDPEGSSQVQELISAQYPLSRASERIRRLAQWAIERVDAIELEGDLTGIRELEKGFREIEEYKKWMED